MICACLHVRNVKTVKCVFLLLDAILCRQFAGRDAVCVCTRVCVCVCVGAYTQCITCLLAARQGVEWSLDSTEWPLVLYIHTAGAPGPRTAEKASLTDDNKARVGCIGEGPQSPSHLEEEQENIKKKKKHKENNVFDNQHQKNELEKVKERLKEGEQWKDMDEAHAI